MGRPTKILVVDDNASVREVFTVMLSLHGFQVITAEDGLSGLKTAEAVMPDLIVTDIDMPKLDGIQMIAILRQRTEFMEVPILVISGCNQEKATSALMTGANQAVSKPVDFDSFIGLVSQLLPATLT